MPTELATLRKLLLGHDPNRRPAWADLALDGGLDTSRWDRFLTRMYAEGVVTRADWEYVQAVWDLNESLKPEAVDPDVAAMFTGLRPEAGDCLIAFGWAMAEDLLKLGSH